MEYFEQLESPSARGAYRPRGEASAGQLVDLIAAALKFASDKQLSEIIVNVTDMYGFDAPGPAFRRWAVRRWAETAENSICVAMVARYEHICPEKTGLLVAAEQGLAANIFETEADAILWLDARTSAVLREAEPRPHQWDNDG